MNKGKKVMGSMAAIVAVVVLSLGPASSAPNQGQATDKYRLFGRAAESNFTPAGADPKLAAALQRARLRPSRFQFTPATTRSENQEISVTVAVRTVRPLAMPSVAPRARGFSAAPAPSQPKPDTPLAITPGGYKLGTSVGWRGFAVAGKTPSLEFGAKAVRPNTDKVGTGYRLPRRLSTRVQLESEAFGDAAIRSQYKDQSLGLDVGGSYRLSRKLNVMAGVKYKAERDRLDRAPDAVRDSQAVYVGTRFKF